MLVAASEEKKAHADQPDLRIYRLACRANRLDLRIYRLEERGIDRIEEISTGVSSESTGQRRYQPECRVNQPDRGDINRSVAESTGQGKYQPECRVNRPDRGDINRRNAESTGLRKYQLEERVNQPEDHANRLEWRPNQQKVRTSSRKRQMSKHILCSERELAHGIFYDFLFSSSNQV
ncbi:hypothetical protein [Virgibacillus alimentarius]|uniref:hypothetical protein n=1 Tax=Virgibacillus alimentarius TaxID=698769 RepID=UPI000A9C66AC|nr:hypothetical protein [Virgibacillus alimentarius]